MGTKDAIRDIVRQRFYADRPFLSGTVDSGSTTTLVDATLGQGMVGEPTFIGVYVYIDDTTDDLAPEGERSRVKEFTRSSGTLTVDPAFSVAPAASDLYELYYDGLHEGTFDNAINDAIRIGTDDAVSSFSDDTTAQTALSDDTVAQGALWLLFQAKSARLSGENKNEALTLSQQHREIFEKLVQAQGYMGTMITRGN